MMKKVVAAFMMVAGLASPVAAQVDPGPLMAAKDLYASARYDEALTVLNGLRPSDVRDRKSVEQYRSLCLLALGRATEAESAIAAVVTADPLYQPGETDASPRVRATFTEVRRRLLPDIATSRYAAAKATYDRQDWAAAEEQFKVVLRLIDDPDTGGRLSDLRMLTVGFLELSAKAAAPPPPPPAPEPAPAPAPQPEPVSPLAPAAPEPGKVYDLDDDGVVAPAAVKQDIPKVPSAILPMAKSRGLLEIVIDDQGRVVSIVMRGSIHPTYDSQLMSAAKDWKYEPARFNGFPVQFRKLIQIAIVR
ncbi:MAG: energy transducer TonB [Vicinamibacterales bacterium]